MLIKPTCRLASLPRFTVFQAVLQYPYPGLFQTQSATAFTADLFGCEFDKISGFHFSGHGFGYTGAQRMA